MNTETTNFFNAIRSNELEEVQQLLNANPDLVHGKDERGSTPLILATYYNHEAIANLILRKNAKIDVNAVNFAGATPLIYATTFNRQAIIKMLLTKNADATVKDQRGNTALDHAKMQGLDELITLLE